MTVEFKVVDQVAYVTINRPERMNAVDKVTDNALQQAWLTIEADSAIRCVVLSGAGDRAFCAGADMKSSSNLTGLEYWGNANADGFGHISLRKTLNVPIIAKVNGFALGGGFEMVLGCDIVVATQESFFGLPEARVGRLPLDGGMVLLQRQIPKKIAAGILLSGRRLPASEALEHGLINEVVSHDQLDDAVERWVDDIKRCAPLSVKALKYTLSNTGHMTPQEAQAHRSAPMIAALQSKDTEEGVQAFLEKRDPVWTGE
ncbi:MAG: enoyl-CoA hydratase-related protein [Amphritea sp.]